MRTEAIWDHIDTYSKRVEKKKEKLNSRMKTLLGDAIMLAATVVYLGPFSPEERERFRLNLQRDIQAKHKIIFNDQWKVFKSAARDIKPQRNMFWPVLKDIGLKEILSLDNLPGVLSPNDLAESLFILLFAPSTPVVCDPSG